MVTAGHCGPGHWYQGYYDDKDKSVYKTGGMGNTTEVQWGDGRIDGATIGGGSYLAAIFTTNTSGVPQTGPAAVGNGTKVCADGSFTGMSCGTVNLVNVCILVKEDPNNGPTYNVCGLDRAVSTSRITQHGDSEGPVVVTTDKGVALAGLISAGPEDGKTVYFTYITNILNTFGARVATL